MRPRHRVRAPHRILGAGLWLLVGLAAAQPPQQDHRTGFVPADDATFGVLRRFYDLDDGLPLDARIVESWDTGSARFETVVFSAQSGERVPGDLARPAGGDGPFPCAVLVHGLGSYRDRWWDEDRRSLPESLLAAGIAVFTLDLRYHGQRSAANDYENPVYLTFGDSLFVRNRDMIIHSTLDVRRALAYLRERGDIDGERIALMGYSMGSMIAMTVSALEPSVSGMVLCSVPTGVREQPSPIDAFHFAPRTAAPALLLIGRDDWLSSPADAELLLSLLPHRDKRLVFYEAGHRLPPGYLAEAAGWLTERLR